MNNTPETPAPKKPRALPKVWRRFLYLDLLAVFYIGRCGYVKSGFFTAYTIDGSRRITLPPWRKVQSDVLVRDARPGGKSSFVVTEPNPGLAPFVADVTCSGGHADPPVNNDNNITGPTS